VRLTNLPDSAAILGAQIRKSKSNIGGQKVSEESDSHLLSRRTLLTGSAGLVGAGLLASACSTASAPTPHTSASASAAGSDLGAVEHVVFLMQENRSFDHYFGSYPGVRGFDDRPKSGFGNFAQAWPGGAADTLLPYNLASATAQICSGNASIPIHDWEPQHASWAKGTNADFLKTHLLAQNDGKDGPLVMGYFNRKQLDFYYELASRYTILDHYFCSVIGPTMPNRLTFMSGMIDPSGQHGGPVLETPGFNNSKDAVGSVQWDTLPEALEDKGVSWKIYQQPGTSVGPNMGVALADGFNVMLYFKQFVSNPASALYQKAFLPSWPSEFESDVKTGALPSVSWLLPPLAYSEHPNGSPVAGQYFVHRVISALQANAELWSKTVVVLCYDENGGFFDHVTPPTPPAGTPGEFVTASPLPSDSGGTAGPVGLGFRVPAMIISPFSTGGYVDSTVFDHHSAAMLLEQRFGIVAPNISAWRRKTVGDLTSTLGFSKPVDAVPTLPATPLDLPTGCPTLTNPIPFVTPPEAINLPTVQAMPSQEPGKARRR
jgi:phospholipase C